MNTSKINELSIAASEDVKYAQEISSKIVSKYSIEIDTLMQSIQEKVINTLNQDDLLLECYLLQLTGALYNVNTQIDNFSFYDDITRANATLAYSERYVESQMNAAAEGRKATQADHQQYAETNSVNEKMLNLIYGKSVKILKNKVDAAYQMVDTLKRILRHHEQEAFYDRQTKSIAQ